MNPQSGVIAVLAAAALLTAACASGSPSPRSSSSPGSADSPSVVGYVQCMRSHGVPDYPGPGSNGQLAKIFSGQQVGVSDTRLTAAQGACQRQWPYQPPSQAQQQQMMGDYVQFAQCMRTHGVPGFPDPTSTASGPRFDLSVSKDGFDPHSPQILAKAHACAHVLPAGTRLPEVTVSS